MLENPSMRMWVGRGDPDKILQQEADGQRSFIESDTLPSRMSCSDLDVNAILQAAGVKFCGIVKDDPIFQYVELPQGWKKVATEESRWSKLLDDKDRDRASIFYKAAFYDRSAYLTLSFRFRFRPDYDQQDKGIAVARVVDCGKVVYTTELIALPGGSERYSLINQVNQMAIDWLNQNYPDWQNPGAYWD